MKDKFDELNKDHLFEYEFNVFGFMGIFCIARTWTFAKLSADKTEKETFLFEFCFVEKMFPNGLTGRALSLVFVPFFLMIGRG